MNLVGPWNEFADSVGELRGTSDETVALIPRRAFSVGGTGDDNAFVAWLRPRLDWCRAEGLRTAVLVPTSVLDRVELYGVDRVAVRHDASETGLVVHIPRAPEWELHYEAAERTILSEPAISPGDRGGVVLDDAAPVWANVVVSTTGTYFPEVGLYRSRVVLEHGTTGLELDVDALSPEAIAALTAVGSHWMKQPVHVRDVEPYFGPTLAESVTACRRCDVVVELADASGIALHDTLVAFRLREMGSDWFQLWVIFPSAELVELVRTIAEPDWTNYRDNYQLRSKTGVTVSLRRLGGDADPLAFVVGSELAHWVLPLQGRDRYADTPPDVVIPRLLEELVPGLLDLD